MFDQALPMSEIEAICARVLRKFVGRGHIAMTIHVGMINFNFGRKRTPQTLPLLDERDKFLLEATRHFPGLSVRAITAHLRSLSNDRAPH
jgi:hypothetical protein